MCIRDRFGTLALLVFLFWYLVQSVRIYRRVDLHESISWVGFGLFAAVLVYMFAGIVNDSNVCTAPVFWGMLGLGLAVNRMPVSYTHLDVYKRQPLLFQSQRIKLTVLKLTATE